MAWTVPAPFERIPVQVAADMRARCRDAVQLATVIPEGGDLVQSFADDRTLTGLQLFDRTEFAGCDVFSKIFDRRDVFRNEVPRC